MKVTGTFIKNEITLRTAKLQAMSGSFEKSLHYFPSESKPNPREISTKILKLERELAIWQTAQKEFNVTIHFDFEGRRITLLEAISSIGGYSRLSKLWKTAAGAKKKDRYGRLDRELTRSTESIVAEESISKEEALEEFEKIETKTSELRTQIGIHNNREVDMPWLETALASL